MAFYIDSAYLDDIIEASQTVPVSGVTTNPTIMLAAVERGQRLTPLSLLNELLSRVGGTIFIQPGAAGEQEMLREALDYVQEAPERVIPKIPMTHIGLRVARQLKIAGKRVAFTAVTTVPQAYAAAMSQADFIIPYYNRMERAGVDASLRISQMAELLHNHQLPTRLLAASFKSPQEVAKALLAGAHDLTIAPQLLLEMVSDPQSEQAVEKFAQDWQKMKIL
ncbi:MAG TPA: transaldolase family protein [Ktedonosporobacter sp.]|jgi:TalC/MipB family fructose-6-phosphate aldolase|nr:transaldolase family protein [Ktedonosporobacter sp.]